MSSSQSSSTLFPYQSSFSGAIALVEEHSQPSCSGTSLSCFDSSRGAGLSNHMSTSRPPKRTRCSVIRGGDNCQNGSESPSSSWIGKNKLTNPSKDALSRISRSLNQKVVSECTGPQKLRKQQTKSSERSSLQPRSSCTHVSATTRLTKPESSNRGTIVQRQPEQSAPSVRNRGTKSPFVQAERHTPTIANSPRKARIKALLKTIDHAGSFAGKSSSAFTAADDRKPPNRSQLTLRKDREQENQPHSSQLMLGLPRALPVPAHSTSPLPPASSTPVANLMGGMLQSATNSPSVPGSLHAEPSHLSDLGRMIGMPTTQHDNKTRTGRQPWQTKGYRSSDPYSATSCGLGSPSDDLIVKSDKCHDLALIPCSTRLHADNESLSLTPRISIPGSDDVEVNFHCDEASSSSYGDIDIDPTALEDACKAYDA